MSADRDNTSKTVPEFCSPLVSPLCVCRDVLNIALFLYILLTLGNTYRRFRVVHFIY